MSTLTRYMEGVSLFVGTSAMAPGCEFSDYTNSKSPTTATAVFFFFFQPFLRWVGGVARASSPPGSFAVLRFRAVFVLRYESTMEC